MKMCDYGCGEEALYHLVNGKWCCSENIASCPGTKLKMKKAWEKRKKRKSYKEEQTKRGKKQSIIMKELWNEGIYDSEEYRIKISDGVKKIWKDPNSLYNSVEWRTLQSNLTKNEWKKSGTKLGGKEWVEKISRFGEDNHMFGRCGPESPGWKGGISFGDYCHEWTHELKLFIKDRDNNECQNPQCSMKYKSLVVHHINYDKKDCDPRNLITVCNSCNSTANFSRDWWRSFYEEIIKRKYLKKRMEVNL